MDQRKKWRMKDSFGKNSLIFALVLKNWILQIVTFVRGVMDFFEVESWVILLMFPKED